MSKVMLIDAAHAEETRVAVIDGSTITEFDFESRAVKQLRGNIYLAKVVRVEPSLQAAFVEYGGNRHGFLAFNDVHPDYFQIPHADREALKREVESDEDHPDDHVSDEDHDDEADAELERRKRRLMRRYKIQDVLKRRQIMLIQVVKEERGNKGAALTTYLSLAGRYCVLMPNTARGGGISRKITAATDRKRLKSAVASLDTPQGMGLIIRTAGAKRTKAEIKRDYEYLLRLWETIRDTTLKSVAPALIYEEEDLVKRAIRDMYDKELDGICVEGEGGYRDAKEFMRVLMPSQAKKVVAYREATPLFVRYGVEDALSAIHSPVVPLRSGGYLVINQTEALVAIDVNSGRATRERNVEATALKTNLEAAEEAARQLRLRDLAGLIVIDFIDMDESKNNRAVEKVLKDSLASDRARVQMGKISPFGLMEISRQRRRSGLLEGTTHVCPHCEGLGRVRSTESAALLALRALQIEAAKGGASALTLRVPTPVGLYVLNAKRAWLQALEEQAELAITIALDADLPIAEHTIERTAWPEGEERVSLQPAKPLPPPRLLPTAEADDADDEVEDEEDEPDDEAAVEVVAAEDRPGADERAAEARGDDGERGGGGRRRRRRRGSRGREEGAEPAPLAARAPDAEEPVVTTGSDEEDAEGRRRRRGRRGGRRPRDEDRPRDPYVWFRPRLEDPADAYGWSDPYAADKRAEAEAVAQSAAPELELDGAADSAIVSEGVADPASPEPGHVEPEAPARRTRRRRSGRRGAAEVAADTSDTGSYGIEAEAGAEPVEAAPESDQDVAQTLSAPAVPAVDDAVTSDPPALGNAVAADLSPAEDDTADEAVAAAVQEPVEPAFGEPIAQAAAEGEPDAAPPPLLTESAANDVEPAPAPAPREPDPNEITAPPAQPRRGWWRRGG